jgi:transcriptional regulator with XRE-family HTH domain
VPVLDPGRCPNHVREFLTTRRARITPDQIGLPLYGRRRVPGLRREEVAALAGVSVDYYNRLERGNLNGVSDSVLEAVARALHLDEAEHTHLYDLAARPTTQPGPGAAPAGSGFSPACNASSTG